MNNKEKDALALEVYKDVLQPAARDVGCAIKSLMLPLRALVWSIDKIETTMYAHLEKRFENTPLEKLITPAPEIAVPIMQALFYCAENETLREMYLNLLSTSVNVDREKFAHRSYVTIINQLSPLESKLLAEFRPRTPQRMGAFFSMKQYIEKDGKQIRVDNFNNEIEDVDEDPPPITDENSQLIGYSFPKTDKPIASYYVLDSTNGNVVFIQDNVVETTTTSDIVIISAAITNLTRLGLIEIDYGATVKSRNGNNNAYKCFLEAPLLPNWKEAIVHPLLRNWQVQGQPVNNDAVAQNKSLEIKKGVAKLTQFGFNFISACVLESEFIQA
jgi:hypothetical protein